MKPLHNCVARTSAPTSSAIGGLPALASRIHHIEGLPYLAFILPGLLVMTVVAQSFSNTSTSLFQAKSEGYIEDVRGRDRTTARRVDRARAPRHRRTGRVRPTRIQEREAEEHQD